MSKCCFHSTTRTPAQPRFAPDGSAASFGATRFSSGSITKLSTSSNSSGTAAPPRSAAHGVRARGTSACRIGIAAVLGECARSCLWPPGYSFRQASWTTAVVRSVSDATTVAARGARGGGDAYGTPPPGRLDDRALVSAMIKMAQTLGLGMVAEGVEDFSRLLHLQEDSCEQAQGFLLNRPLPAAEVRTSLMRLADNEATGRTTRLRAVMK